MTSLTMHYASSSSSPSDKGSSSAPGHFKYFKVITACYQVLVSFCTCVSVGGLLMVFNLTLFDDSGLRSCNVVSPLYVRVQGSCIACIEQWWNDTDRGN